MDIMHVACVCVCRDLPHSQLIIYQNQLKHTYSHKLFKSEQTRHLNTVCTHIHAYVQTYTQTVF